MVARRALRETLSALEFIISCLGTARSNGAALA